MRWGETDMPVDKTPPKTLCPKTLCPMDKVPQRQQALDDILPWYSTSQGQYALVDNMPWWTICCPNANGLYVVVPLNPVWFHLNLFDHI